MMEATAEFARHLVRTRYDDLPPEVVEITKQQVLDLLGVAVSGIGQPGAKELVALLAESGGRPESTVIGCGLRLPAADAAQLNATLAHTRDYDDVHESAVMHPGVVTIMPALAIAERIGGCSGRDLIAAVALGTDLICRLGLATRPGVSPLQTGWHFTSLYGYPTAALTAARLLGLDEARTLNAFGIAYHQCSGNGQAVTDGALTKRLGPGMASRGGVMAALMAQRGITGARESLEGRQGLFQVYHHGEFDRDELVGGLGTRWENLRVSLKPYPCCRGIHPTIDAALALHRRLGGDASRVRGIALATGAANHRLLCTPHEAKVRPRNPVDAQFSIPWGLVIALRKGRVTMADFGPDAVADEATLALAACVRTQVDEALNSPRGIEAVRVTVTLDDGTELSEIVRDPTGSPGQPLSWSQIVEKFDDCLDGAGGAVPASRARHAVELVRDLERLTDVRELIALFA
ncbi:MAG: MmgE/PrpD family protein [Burkholderiaceae bacterium]|jgi:2-methylcitrate dehydratase PrpD|nr:MmgE/PrpD family protein [Burkholderiaceae bacterium]